MWETLDNYSAEDLGFVILLRLADALGRKTPIADAQSLPDEVLNEALDCIYRLKDLER